jgi:hypothetical protein
MKKIYMFLAFLLVSSSIFAQLKNVSTVQTSEKATKGYSKSIGYSNSTKGIALYDNGPLITDPAAGPAGSNMSLVQDPNTSWGFSHAKSTLMRVADDVNVLATSWAIDSIVFFAYQTGSTTTTSTFTAYNVRIWNGVPGAAGSTVVWGDTTTNVLTSSYWSGIYRGSDLTGTTRPIFRNVCTTPALTLNGGAYWIDWQAEGSLTSGPWAPAITIVGQVVTGNAMQSSDNVWGDLIDGTNPQGLPFIVYGTATGAYTNDVSCTAITAPVQGDATTATTQVKIKVKNNLTASQSNIPVTCKVNSSVLTGTVAGPLASGEEVEYTFTNTVDMAAFGPYDLVAYTSLAGDQNLTNDTVKKSITHLPAVSVNWNFNQGIPSNFTLINDANVAYNATFTNAWVAYTDADPLTEDSCAASTSWFSPAGTANRWMITNSVVLTSGNMLQWDAKVGEAAYPDGYMIKLSTTGNAVSDFTNTLISVSAEQATWTNHVVDLTAYNGQTVYFAIIQNSVDMNYLLIDNVKVLGNATVGVKEVATAENFNIFPNPANDKLHIAASNIQTVEIFNLTGARVASYGNQNIIGISNLAQGTYLVKVITDNKVTTQKINIVR